MLDCTKANFPIRLVRSEVFVASNTWIARVVIISVCLSQIIVVALGAIRWTTLDQPDDVQERFVL